MEKIEDYRIQVFDFVGGQVALIHLEGCRPSGNYPAEQYPGNTLMVYPASQELADRYTAVLDQEGIAYETAAQYQEKVRILVESDGKINPFN
jgi:hypothetical protein